MHHQCLPRGCYSLFSDQLVQVTGKPAARREAEHPFKQKVV